MSVVWKLVLAAAVVGAAGLAFVVVDRSGGASLESAAYSRLKENAPGLCPWREPERDMRALFPGASGYTTDLLILTPLRLPILKRLGSGARLDSNALYVYRVERGRAPAGVVAVQRTSGEYGAIEVVAGILPNGKLAGVRLQRLREPPETATVIGSARWLAAFDSKTADSDFTVGKGLPSVPAAARTSATAVAQAARLLLVEYDAGKHSSAVPEHHHV